MLDILNISYYSSMRWIHIWLYIYIYMITDYTAYLSPSLYYNTCFNMFWLFRDIGCFPMSSESPFSYSTLQPSMAFQKPSASPCSPSLSNTTDAMATRWAFLESAGTKCRGWCNHGLSHWNKVSTVDCLNESHRPMIPMLEITNQIFYLYHPVPLLCSKVCLEWIQSAQNNSHQVRRNFPQGSQRCSHKSSPRVERWSLTRGARAKWPNPNHETLCCWKLKHVQR